MWHETILAGRGWPAIVETTRLSCREVRTDVTAVTG